MEGSRALWLWWVEGGVAQAGRGRRSGYRSAGEKKQGGHPVWEGDEGLDGMSWIRKPLTLLPTHELFRGQALLAFNPEGKLINLSFLLLIPFHLPSLSLQRTAFSAYQGEDGCAGTPRQELRG